MNILITGATGTLGSEVLKGLQTTEHKVVCFNPPSEKTSNLPSCAKVEYGDLTKPETFGKAFTDIDSLFLINALSKTETEQGLNAVTAAKEFGIEKIVYLSTFMPDNSIHIPHYKSKIPVETAIKKSNIDYTIIRPNNYFQNDYWFMESILNEKIYPQPIGDIGINRLDTRDIAEIVVKALTKEDFNLNEITVHGPETHTGIDVADILSEQLNVEIYYAGNNLDVWYAKAIEMLPIWVVNDLRIMYEYCQEYGLKARGEDVSLVKDLLGRDLLTYDNFASEISKEIIGN